MSMWGGTEINGRVNEAANKKLCYGANYCCFFFSFHLNYYMLVVQSTLLHYENVK